MKNRQKQQILSSLLSLTLVACQVPPPSGPQTQKPSQNQTPVLLAPKGPDMPQKLRAMVEQKGGNPAFVKVVPIQEMKDLFSKPQKPNAKRVERPLKKHFSLAQTGQESCDWSSMNICGYQEVGNWQEYYDAIYNDFASFYNGLCAYQDTNYCVYDQEQACHIQTREMQFYGCSCRDGYEKTAEGCTRPLALKIKYTRPGSTTPDEGELMISPLQPNHPNNEVEIEVHDDGKNYWELNIFNANGEQVFNRSGDPFAQEKVFKWSGTVYGNDSEYLPNGVYTIRLSSNEQIVERNVRIENSLLFLVTYNMAVDSLPPPQEIMPFRPAQSGEPSSIRIQVFQQPSIPWAVKIKNAQGEVLENYSIASSSMINVNYWYGKDPQTGEYLPNGLYSIELESNGETRVQKVLIDHHLQLTLKGLSRIGEEPVSENIEIAPGAQPGPGVYNEIDMQIEPKGSLPWQLRILNESQQSVYEHEDNSAKNLRWEGRNANTNAFLPNGLYTVIASSDGETKSQTFRINNQLRLRIKYNTLPPIYLPQQELPIIYPFTEGKPTGVDVHVDTIDTSPWSLSLYKSNGEKIREWTRSMSGGGIDTGLVSWGGETEFGLLLPSGDYTFVLKSGPDEIRRTVRVDSAPSLQVLFGNISGGGFGATTPEGEVFLTPGKQDGILDHARLLIGASEQDSWLLEIKDFGNSTVWYERSNGSKEIHWRGTNQANQIVPEGRYTARLTSGSTQRSQTLRVDDLANPKLKLYFGEYLQKLLDSIEPRLAVAKRETEMLYERTREAIPNAPAFQVQRVPDIAGFRIQQQQVDPEPTEDLSHYPLAEQTDVYKTNVDAQNDRILAEVHKIRQKLTWIRSTNNTFQTQQTNNGEAKRRTEEAKQLEKKLYGLDTANGCFNYYSVFKAQWKRPLRTPGSDSGGGGGGNNNEPEAQTSIQLLGSFLIDDGIEIKGRINHPPNNFDYNSLKIDFFGDVNNVGTKNYKIESDGSFSLKINQFNFTQQYINKLNSKFTNDPTSVFIGFFEPLNVRVSLKTDNFQIQQNTPCNSLFPCLADTRLIHLNSCLQNMNDGGRLLVYHAKGLDNLVKLGTKYFNLNPDFSSKSFRINAIPKDGIYCPTHAPGRALNLNPFSEGYECQGEFGPNIHLTSQEWAEMSFENIEEQLAVEQAMIYAQELGPTAAALAILLATIVAPPVGAGAGIIAGGTEAAATIDLAIKLELYLSTLARVNPSVLIQLFRNTAFLTLMTQISRDLLISGSRLNLTYQTAGPFIDDFAKMCSTKWNNESFRPISQMLNQSDKEHISPIMNGIGNAARNINKFNDFVDSFSLIPKRLKDNLKKYLQKYTHYRESGIRPAHLFNELPSFVDSLNLFRQEATSATEPLRKHFATIGLEIMEKANLNGLRVKESAMPDFDYILQVDFSNISSSARERIRQRRPSIVFENNSGLKFVGEPTLADYLPADEMLIDYYRKNPINGKYLIPPARSAQEAAQMGTSIYMSPQDATNLIDQLRRELRLSWHHVEDLKTMLLVPLGVHGANKHVGGANMVLFLPGQKDRILQWEQFINTGINKASNEYMIIPRWYYE